MPQTLRLLAASALTYAINDAGPASPYDGIANLSNIKTFSRGFDQINAALIGTADFGVVLVFRCTLPPVPGREAVPIIADWVQNIEVELEVGSFIPGQVHHGFLGALDSLWDEVSAELKNQLAASPVKRLFVTGHSKGGAMAHLAATRCALTSIIAGTQITVRTFEAPLPGNSDFASGYARLVPDAVRYEFQDDLVPHLPPGSEWRLALGNVPGLDNLADLTEDFDYSEAATLAFVDWSGDIVGDSALLSFERKAHLVAKLSGDQRLDVITDHFIDPNSGLWKAISALT